MSGFDGAARTAHRLPAEDAPPLAIASVGLLGLVAGALAVLLGAVTATAPVGAERASALDPRASDAPAGSSLAPAPTPTPTPAPAPAPASPGQSVAVAQAAEDAPAEAGGAPGAVRAPAAVAVDCPPLFPVVFDSNSGTPHVERALVDGLVAWLRRHPDAVLVVDGHASSRGTAALNLELSRRRAGKAAALFERAGLAPGRITRRGFGSYAPLPGAADESSRNRVVILSVAGGPPCPPAGDPGASPVPSPEVGK